jgi:hypothetical protein
MSPRSRGTCLDDLAGDLFLDTNPKRRLRFGFKGSQRCGLLCIWRLLQKERKNEKK